MTSFPLHLPAIKVRQPLGDFFVVSLDAATLEKITFLDPTRISSVDKRAFWYSLLGAQRPSSERRAKQIAKYINTVEAAFPNSIILAANYVETGELQEDDKKRWKIKLVGEKIYELIIPTPEPMASVVDGQHRLLGFKDCNSDRKNMELLCAVYMDLPHAYQAYLFATININQRKVDKSLAYEQFGYNLDDEKKESWSPDKLAVFFTRRLNLNPHSPLYRRIKIAPMNAESLFAEGERPDWQVSTACVVEGIGKLLAQSPKDDRDLLHESPVGSRVRSALARDMAPLRSFYLENQDERIYEIIEDYFSAVRKKLWDTADVKSYIKKTVGVQALFDVLRSIIQNTQDYEMLTEELFLTEVGKCTKIDFSDSFFQASGTGRTRIRNCLELCIGIRSLESIQSGQEEYRRLCKLS